MKLRTLLLLARALLCSGSAAVGVNQLRLPSDHGASQTVPVVTMSSSLTCGVQVTEGDVRLEHWPAGLVPAGTLQTLEEAIGRAALTPLVEGEPVMQGKLAARDSGRGLAAMIPNGMRAFTIRTPHVAAGMGGFILPGDRVDVLLTTDDLIATHSIAPEVLTFLAACVEARANILISGGTGSGKTTLLNALSSFIPANERVATIEDAAELQLQQPHVVRMETRPANIEGGGEVTTRDLVRNSLRMRTDRIVVGECRSAEALDMRQAMNTGQEGSLTTVHANSTRDATSRLEMMVGMAGFELPVWTIRRQLASAIQIVVQVSRLMGGARKVVKVSDITGMEGDVLSMHDIFEFCQTGLDEHRRATGYFYATGIRPYCLSRIESAGIHVGVELFEERELYVQEPIRKGV